MFLQIDDSSLQFLGIVVEVTDAEVTSAAKQTSYFTSRMYVINTERLLLMTDRTQLVLSTCQCFYIFLGEIVSLLEMRHACSVFETLGDFRIRVIVSTFLFRAARVTCTTMNERTLPSSVGAVRSQRIRFIAPLACSDL